jgi:2-polyprenyl-6-methoxyphenol hydroxylase-like FAD-dependent oxidoreductase
MAPLPSTSFDVIIIGAGPVGLALSIELARAGKSTLVVDRRPHPADDVQLRSQLLVARRGDLANLAHLGVDIRDPYLVSPIATRSEADLASGRVVHGGVIAVRGTPARAENLRALAAQPPIALVPIGRLQQALLTIAERYGAIVAYGLEVTKLRRHQIEVSIACANGEHARGRLAIIATGAARSLVGALHSDVLETPRRRLIAGVFDASDKLARWVRAEIPVAGLAETTRCTLLQTSIESKAGAAMLVDPRVTAPTAEQLEESFALAARAYGLTGAPFLAPPRSFPTAVTALTRRYLAGDNRAPVAIAGDAAQTGHVFSGQTCFVNLALALRLAELLRAHTVTIALARYDAESEDGARILANASTRHFAAHPPGAWALAGVARAEA